MLVLSREEGESIVLKLTNSEHIRIVLTVYSGQQTKVGIDAPNNVEILRKELLEH